MRSFERSCDFEELIHAVLFRGENACPEPEPARNNETHHGRIHGSSRQIIDDFTVLAFVSLTISACSYFIHVPFNDPHTRLGPAGPKILELGSDFHLTDSVTP